MVYKQNDTLCFYVNSEWQSMQPARLWCLACCISIA